MRLEDWAATQSNGVKEMCVAIERHNTSLVNGHNGLIYITIKQFKCSEKRLHGNYHFAVRKFESHCERSKTKSDFPLGNSRWIHHHNDL